MSKTINLAYILQLKHLKQLEVFGITNCHTCKKQFQVGDRVYSKKTNRSHKTIRCFPCARRVNLV